jgi:peroxiredoxin Q/BCP
MAKTTTRSTTKTRTKARTQKRPATRPAKPTKAAKTGALRVGDKAPVFALRDQSDAVHKLADHKGRKLLVYFYPKADTPGCTVQSCSVRDARRDLGRRGVDAVGISPDKPSAQQKFDTKYRLGFPLLADEDHAVAEAYGVWAEKSMYGRKYMGILRSAFLVDEQGKIAGAWYGVSPKDTVPGALAALDA